MFAEVAINRPVHQTFSYHIPSALAGLLEPGHLVRVGFRTAQAAAIVVNITRHAPDFVTKPVLERLDPIPIVSPTQIAVAQWMAESTYTPIGLCLWLMVPPGATQKSDYLYQLHDATVQGQTPTEKEILSLLKRRGDLPGREINRIISKTGWRKSIKNLVDTGIVTSQATLTPPTVQPKTVRTATLAVDLSDVSPLHLGRESKRANVLEVLANQAEMSMAEAAEAAGCTQSVLRTLADDGTVELYGSRPKMARLLLNDNELYELILDLRGARPYWTILTVLAENGGTLTVSEIYTATDTTIAHLKQLQEEEYITLGEEESLRDSLAGRPVSPATPPTLTPDQQSVWDTFQAQTEGVFLLHGVTGAGKTELYMQAVADTLAQGRSAIVMVPEIALTTQMIQRFTARFPGQVGIVHSTLSMGERFDTWRRARAGALKVIIGARSALFTPLPDLGLIILDEEHDDSYKQSPPLPPPYYHAREVAIEYMRLNHGKVILGSATPDVISYNTALRGNYTLLELPERIGGLPLPPVQIVDMRQELRMGNTSIFSRRLREAMHATLGRGEQMLLFLNRRGTATYVFCRDCGYIAKCSRCDTPLTYHRAGEALVCHHCNNREPNPSQCPNCGSARIKFFGRGTEQIEHTLQTDFPEARVLRWDQDTASRRGAHEEIYTAFQQREADILVGTQMIAKGLDLPYVTLVGILSGDTALGLPDYRANENTFQLLTQVAGRAGRSTRGGEVLLQTYQPDHYAIQAAADHDYATFYAQEIHHREALHWPPFIRLANVLFRNTSETQAQQQAHDIAAALRQRVQSMRLTATEVIGPTPCFFTKIDNYYRWQIIVRSPDPVLLFQDFDLGVGITLDIDPIVIL